eukprot:scaffold7948_cov94-Isochrysis_galbana.AAC.2
MFTLQSIHTPEPGRGAGDAGNDLLSRLNLGWATGSVQVQSPPDPVVGSALWRPGHRIIKIKKNLGASSAPALAREGARPAAKFSSITVTDVQIDGRRVMLRLTSIRTRTTSLVVGGSRAEAERLIAKLRTFEVSRTGRDVWWKRYWLERAASSTSPPAGKAATPGR